MLETVQIMELYYSVVSDSGTFEDTSNIQFCGITKTTDNFIRLYDRPVIRSMDFPIFRQISVSYEPTHYLF